jgi:cell division septal protein FtsQ
MNRDPASVSAARSWRDIPQQVKPRAMSPRGRQRLMRGLLSWVGGGTALLLVAWGAWEVTAVWRGDSAGLPGAAKAAPLKYLELSTNGVLDRGWLAQTLALPKDATLAGLDLERLRARILASGQVAMATIIRQFPATLKVDISERQPVARIRLQQGGGQRDFLAASDGVIYDGAGYDPAMTASLPWLDGVRPAVQGGGFTPIANMPKVAELLAQAKLEAEPLYRTWWIVSLKGLDSDGEIEVRTHAGLKVIFGTQEDFFPQLARLDLLLDTGPPGISTINLAYGKKVPVSFATAGAPPAAPSPAFSIFSHPANSIPREF